MNRAAGVMVRKEEVVTEIFIQSSRVPHYRMSLIWLLKFLISKNQRS